MSKILVAYASRTGCTKEAAEIIGATLRSAAGAEVDLRPVQEVNDLTGYTAIVVGSAARNKRGWLSEGRHWLRGHETELSKLPVAYFMTCWVLRDDTPAARAEAEGYIGLVQEKYPAIRPLAVGLFPGRLDLSRFSAFDRFWMRMKHAPAGDWFDGERVRAWAEQAAKLL
jgi:menaquinone-dependent protoporphyrinogen oxidase